MSEGTQGASCESCGAPMKTAEEHGAGDAANAYCRTCTDDAGKLKPREEITEGFTKWIMECANNKESARMVAEWLMSYQPAWQKR